MRLEALSVTMAISILSSIEASCLEHRRSSWRRDLLDLPAADRSAKMPPRTPAANLQMVSQLLRWWVRQVVAGVAIVSALRRSSRLTDSLTASITPHGCPTCGDSQAAVNARRIVFRLPRQPRQREDRKTRRFGSISASETDLLEHVRQGS